MTEGKMNADEVHTNASLVHRLLKAQFPRWADLPIRPVSSAGTVNAMYRLGDDLVVRLPRIGWYIEDAEKNSPSLPAQQPRPRACADRRAWRQHRRASSSARPSPSQVVGHSS